MRPLVVASVPSAVVVMLSCTRSRPPSATEEASSAADVEATLAALLPRADLDALLSTQPGLRRADPLLVRRRARELFDLFEESQLRSGEAEEAIAAAPAMLLSDRPPRELAPRLAALQRAHGSLLARLGVNASRVLALAAERRAAQPRLSRMRPRVKRFFAKKLVVLDSVTVRAHATVADSALHVAADRVARMLRGLPPSVREQLRRRGASVSVIGTRQVTTDLPEHRHLRGQRQLHPGEASLEAAEEAAVARAPGHARKWRQPKLFTSGQLCTQARPRTRWAAPSNCHAATHG